MAVRIRGKADNVLKKFAQALDKYAAEHAKAKIEIYRQNDVSVRVRVIDPEFEGMDRSDRHDLVWSMLEDLPEEVLWEISVLLLLTPKEAKTSYANMEFDHPATSIP